MIPAILDMSSSWSYVTASEDTMLSMLSMLVLLVNADTDDEGTDDVGSSMGGADFADNIVSPGPEEMREGWRE